MIHSRSPLVQVFSICFVLVLGLIPATWAYGHPFHLCVGQMKWNAGAKVWEVSLRLHPQDLEKSLNAELVRHRPRQHLSIDDDGFPAIATMYFGSHFFVRRTPAALKREELNAILESSKSKSWATAESALTKMDELFQEQSSLKWIGMEQERGWLWIHLELTAPSVEPARHKLWMVNRILVDSVERQENTVAIDPVDTKKFSLQFRSGEEFQELKPAK